MMKPVTMRINCGARTVRKREIKRSDDDDTDTIYYMLRLLLPRAACARAPGSIVIL